ncbi:MAG TPA: SagB/ThcOx family dehydrogenase [Synergistales bacterium]|nr:SagB/ThcOx family dehydrogenase [Synergistales bacterium]
MTDRKIGQEFLKFTQYEFLEESDQFRGLPQPPLEVPCMDGSLLLKLPSLENLKIPLLDMGEAIVRRASRRSYTGQEITPGELSWLLWCTQGVKEMLSEATIRNVPSAGARHPLETYLSIHNVSGIDQGLYRYIATRHSLQEIRKDPGFAHKLTRACLGQKFILSSAVTFIWTVDMYRSTWRYGQRGYRYIFLDAGHACQNLYLSAESVGCGVCAVAAFHDRSLTELLELDGVDHFPIYLASVGKVEKE